MVLSELIMMLIEVLVDPAVDMDYSRCESLTLLPSTEKVKTKFTNFSVKEILRSNFGDDVSRCRRSGTVSKDNGITEQKQSKLLDFQTKVHKVGRDSNAYKRQPKISFDRQDGVHKRFSHDSFECLTPDKAVCDDRVVTQRDEKPIIALDTNKDVIVTKEERSWPAWVFCTRYSDRPSAGPRSKKCNKKSRRPAEKRPRTSFTNQQIQKLKEVFKDNPYITEDRRQSLAQELCLSELQIKIWFQNKRAKLKKSTGAPNILALRLMAEGLYNHTSTKITDADVPLLDCS